ncbi:MAG: hypothetical protein CSA33_06850 [Desulfobulbus propionicus]|nr:MAG: hypothetical protein CSA33_06850 [Desulfobulbus propionicus]
MCNAGNLHTGGVVARKRFEGIDGERMCFGSGIQDPSIGFMMLFQRFFRCLEMAPAVISHFVGYYPGELE